MAYPSAKTTPSASPWPRIIAGLTGAWLAVSMLKFGNPVILDSLVARPGNLIEVLFQPWPVFSGYLLLAGVVGAFVIAWINGALIPLDEKPPTAVVAPRSRGKAGLSRQGEQRPASDSGPAPRANPTNKVPRWLLAAPLVWFAWQLVAAAGTVDPELTRPTLVHFASNAVCFFLGLYALGRVRQVDSLWIALLIGYLLVLWSGFQQHYGGLEAVRQMIYEQPDWRQLSPDYLKKIASDRIFATLVYPNALAGLIVLLTPAFLVALPEMTARIPRILRLVLVGLVAYMGAACLLWSGSKAGWLVAVVVLGLALLHLPMPKHRRWAIVGAVVLVGLLVFFVKFAPYFQKGAPSAGARMDYWRAAALTFLDHPILGSGPGTFSDAYRRIKPPEAEMTRLVHNDFLEQASDSGLVGFLAYAAWVIGALAYAYRKGRAGRCRLGFAVWLGLAGWALHSCAEFFLYIPAMSWPAFVLLGWVCGESATRDSG